MTIKSLRKLFGEIVDHIWLSQSIGCLIVVSSYSNLNDVVGFVTKLKVLGQYFPMVWLKWKVQCKCNESAMKFGEFNPLTAV